LSAETEQKAYLLGWVAARGDLGSGFPELASEALGWAFVRGCFEARGRIAEPDGGSTLPSCELRIESEVLREGIRRFCAIPAESRDDTLEWTGVRALDFLGKLYDDASVFLEKNRRAYSRWLGGGRWRLPVLRFVRLDPRAERPFKRRASDSGFDLTLIREVSRTGSLILYGTGIQIEPEHGYYFDLVARSSIVKSGHILANAVGVIDHGYRGEILVPLYKLVPEAADLTLPCRIVQLVPRAIAHFALVEDEALDETARGMGGFGSSGG
jgi:dUTP pyrophosphatase